MMTYDDIKDVMDPAVASLVEQFRLQSHIDKLLSEFEARSTNDLRADVRHMEANRATCPPEHLPLLDAAIRVFKQAIEQRGAKKGH